MNAMDYAKNIFDNDVIQQHLEQKVEMLLSGPLKEKSDYAQEKAIKTFWMTAKHLESALLHERNIHPNHTNWLDIVGKEEEYFKKLKEVEKLVVNEIDYQYRHFITFLA